MKLKGGRSAMRLRHVLTKVVLVEAAFQALNRMTAYGC